MKINKRAILKVLIDATIWGLITYFAYFLRLDVRIVDYAHDILVLSAFIIPIKLLFVIFNGHYKISWRYSTFYDFVKPVLSVVFFTLVYYIIAFTFGDIYLIPRTVPAIDALLTIIAFVTIRVTAQVYTRKHKVNAIKTKEKKRVLIIGAGESGTMINREMLRHGEIALAPIGFLDDDPQKQGQRIGGIPVLGKISDIQAIVDSEKVEEVIIAMPSESGNVIRKILEEANKAKIPCRTIPRLHEIISGVVSINQLRNVQVEDLLRREPVQLNMDKIEAYLKGKRVLVTGAGGSIGSEIVRQVSSFFPESITLLGRGENSIHEMYQECRRNCTYLKVDAKIIDVRDYNSLENIFKKYKPDVVFHAAAHKHVYLMEANPEQAILNNVIGTRNLVDISLKNNVKTFVNISTDKAINPTSIMGASKRIAELIVQEASQNISGPDQCFVSVRFGNVLGSRGSVVPIFKNQIERGGPITITHPDMMRYFMTIPEASQLVLQAGALNTNGAVFVLDMGEPVKILDMAKDLIRLSGLEPDVDIKIKFTGIRDGEKLFEELLNDEEGTNVTQHEKIFIARKNGNIKGLDDKILNLVKAAESGDPVNLRKLIKKTVPTYSNGDVK